MASMTVLAIPSGARALRACSSAEISFPPCLTTVTSERVGATERGFAWPDGVGAPAQSGFVVFDGAVSVAAFTYERCA